jgi:hypothetical protein
VSRNKAPIWGLRPDFYCCQTLRVCWYEALSLTIGRVCRLQLLLVLASAVILGPESRGTRDHILLSQIRYFPSRRLLRFAGLRWRYSTPPPQTPKSVSVVTSRHGPRRIHHSILYSNRFRGNVFICDGCVSLLIKNMFPSSGCCFHCLFRGRYTVTGIHATIYTLRRGFIYYSGCRKNNPLRCMRLSVALQHFPLTVDNYLCVQNTLLL